MRSANNACLAAFTNIKTLKKPEAFKSWFFKILLNERRKLLTDKFSAELPCQELQTAAEDDGVGEKIELSEPLEILPEPDRTIAPLSVYENCNSSEIALNKTDRKKDKPQSLKKQGSRFFCDIFRKEKNHQYYNTPYRLKMQAKNKLNFFFVLQLWHIGSANDGRSGNAQF